MANLQQGSEKVDVSSARSTRAEADNKNNNKFAVCVAWRGSHQIQKFPIVGATSWVVGGMSVGVTSVRVTSVRVKLVWLASFMVTSVGVTSVGMMSVGVSWGMVNE